MRRGRCGANLLVHEDAQGVIRHDSGALGFSPCRHGGVVWNPGRFDTPTTACLRYGCWANPATGRCNRCGREV